MSVVSQRPTNDAASWSQKMKEKGDGDKDILPRVLNNRSGETMSSSCRQQTGPQKKKKTQCVVGTYGAEMCKIDTAHIRGVIRVGRGKRLFTVCCRNALDRLWCSQSLHSSFNTIIKENKKNNCTGFSYMPKWDKSYCNWADMSMGKRAYT